MLKTVYDKLGTLFAGHVSVLTEFIISFLTSKLLPVIVGRLLDDLAASSTADALPEFLKPFAADIQGLEGELRSKVEAWVKSIVVPAAMAATLPTTPES